MYILGISSYYHDSGVVLLLDDKIIAAVQEERFTRVKHDSSFPKASIQYCLQEAKISLLDLDFIAFYDKPFIKFERILETYLSIAPRGFKNFMMSMPIWLKDKLFLKETLSREFQNLHEILNKDITRLDLKNFKKDITQKLMFAEHHQSHASSAFYPSPFSEAAILTIDGVGEWTTTSLAYGENNKMSFLSEIQFPHSLGLLYSAFTYYLGFKVNSGEYKIMGLAPYGKPKYIEKIKRHLIDIKNDGSFRLNMSYFNYLDGLTMTNDKFHNLFKSPPREPETDLTQKEMDLAASIQAITEEIVIKLAKHAKFVTGSNNLCLAGGVALNCVANGKIIEEKIFDNIWIQPAAGDAGGALGAAYSLYYSELNNTRIIDKLKMDKMEGSYLGPSYPKEEISKYLNNIQATYTYYPSEHELLQIVAQLLSSGQVVGWHNGRMEFGPRALGNRSILGDARSIKMQSIMNLKIKYRESFRPFAPSVLREKVHEWFEMDIDSPYMLLVASVKQALCYNNLENDGKLFGIDKLNVARSKIPAVTHIDNTARIQTVHKETNPRYHKLISQFETLTGCATIVNTSFNIRGEPIVCSPEDSYKCFMNTEMDILVIDNYLLYKTDQIKSNENDNYLDTYNLD